jgi:hypothetical protein
MGVFGDPIEKGLQLYFRDDVKFIFRFLPLEDTFLQLRNKERVVIRGWKHFYSNQFPFTGYKNIPSGFVTISSGRDVITDVYGVIPSQELPDSGVVVKDAKDGNIRLVKIVKWLSEVGEARRLKIMAKRVKNSSYDRIVLFLGIGLMLEILIIVIELLQRRGGS